ncbi:MAG: hypothetical protein CHACPFDD_03972 [Phycisphaerae bacterium]|nr:hypothetical protein [Phycisphaerae bacterium]
MSEREFEPYLNLLTRFLRLNAGQREEIRRELRAHLEEAIEDAIARGVPRDEAIREALDDFGDAAELAARFRSVGQQKRWIMKGTLAAACVSLAALGVNFLWPSAPPRVSAFSWQAGRAQAEPRGGEGRGSEASRGDRAAMGERDAGRRGETAEDARIRAALRETVQDVEFEEQPLSEVLSQLAAALKVNVHVRWDSLEELGVARDTLVSVHLRQVSVERVLRLVLEGLAERVDYEVDEGILVVASRERIRREMVTRVYDVRDLIGSGGGAERQVRGVPGGTRDAIRADFQRFALARVAWVQSNDADAAMVPQSVEEDDAGDGLLELIYAVVEPDEWEVNGGRGQARIYQGTLAVRQTATVQRRLEEFLRDLRAARVGTGR